MIIGLIIGIYITIGILFAMYLIRRNIKDNDGEFFSGPEDGAYIGIMCGTVFWPIGIPIYIIMKLLTWWINYNENKYSSCLEGKIIGCDGTNCPVLNNDELRCLNEHNCKFLNKRR